MNAEVRCEVRLGRNVTGGATIWEEERGGLIWNVDERISERWMLGGGPREMKG